MPRCVASSGRCATLPLSMLPLQMLAPDAVAHLQTAVRSRLRSSEWPVRNGMSFGSGV